MSKRRRLFTLNDPYALRVSPQLAEEIGLNESIVLLQIEFLISISDHFKEQRWWTYQSLRDLQKNYFPWWSIATLSRTIKALEEKELITIGNFNRAGYDKTQWFSLNDDGISRLVSIRLHEVFQNETGVFHPATSAFQNETGVFQNETAIPETTSETTQRLNESNGSKKQMTMDELIAKQDEHNRLTDQIKKMKGSRG